MAERRCESGTVSFSSTLSAPRSSDSTSETSPADKPPGLARPALRGVLAGRVLLAAGMVRRYGPDPAPSSPGSGDPGWREDHPVGMTPGATGSSTLEARGPCSGLDPSRAGEGAPPHDRSLPRDHHDRHPRLGPRLGPVRAAGGAG